MALDFNWDDLPQNSGDPMAGSDYSDVFAQTPLSGRQTTPFSQELPTGLSGSSSIIQKILDSLKSKAAPQMQANGQAPNRLADLGSVLGAFSSGEKANRVLQGNMTQGYDKLMLDAQQGRNLNESDALKKLAQTSYIMGGGSQFKAPTLSLNGKTMQTPDLGFGPKATTDTEKSGASTLQNQLQARLSPGGSYTPQPLDSYAKPGLAENIGSYGGAAVSGLGSVLDAFGNPTTAGSDGQSSPDGVGSAISGISKGLGTAGSIAGLASKLGIGGSKAANAASGLTGAGSTMGNILGKAVPIAGAAMGAYGLAKNQSVGSDVMSGMGAGASLGSFGGPIGTAVGAGVGALVGALRGAFSVTGKEHGGRDAQAQITQNLSKLATPKQMAESKAAGWPDPNQALSLIVMRDKLTQSGLPPAQAEAQAESIMKSMWDSEKSGSDAVAKAASPIQSMMGSSYQGNSPLSGGTPFPPGTDAFSRGARG